MVPKGAGGSSISSDLSRPQALASAVPAPLGAGTGRPPGELAGRSVVLTYCLLTRSLGPRTLHVGAAGRPRRHLCGPAARGAGPRAGAGGKSPDERRPGSGPPASRAPRPPPARPSGRGRLPGLALPIGAGERGPCLLRARGPPLALVPAAGLPSPRPRVPPSARARAAPGEEATTSSSKGTILRSAPKKGHGRAAERGGGSRPPAPRRPPARPPRPAAWPGARRCRCCAPRPSGRPPRSCSSRPGPQVGPRAAGLLAEPVPAAPGPARRPPAAGVLSTRRAPGRRSVSRAGGAAGSPSPGFQGSRAGTRPGPGPQTWPGLPRTDSAPSPRFSPRPGKRAPDPAARLSGASASLLLAPSPPPPPGGGRGGASCAAGRRSLGGLGPPSGLTPGSGTRRTAGGPGRLPVALSSRAPTVPGGPAGAPRRVGPAPRLTGAGGSGLGCPRGRCARSRRPDPGSTRPLHRAAGCGVSCRPGAGAVLRVGGLQAEVRLKS